MSSYTFQLNSPNNSTILKLNRFNDDSVLIGKKDVENGSSSSSQAYINETKLGTRNDKEVIEVDDNSSDGLVSSDADSDFIDVPEVDSDIENIVISNAKKPLPPVFVMNEVPSTSSSISALDVNVSADSKKSDKIEIVFDPNSLCNSNDDLFADVFVSEKIEDLKYVPEKNENRQSSELREKAIENKIETEKQKEEEIVEEGMEKEKEKGSTFVSPAETTKTSKIANILNDLDFEMSTVSKINLNDLPILEPNEPSNNATGLPTNINIMKIIEKKPIEVPTTPPKIPQPFFVKKTPPSSKKKSQGADAIEIDTHLTPSKATKSLLDAFDSLPVPPSTSKAEIVDERETLLNAANVLREQKSKKELEDIADQLSVERRDLATEINKKDRLGVSITEQMSMECMELLRLFGVPYIIAPMEAEAQCAYLNEIDLTDGTITDDSDIWLFGGKTVYKNFFDQNKLVMEFKSNSIETLFHLDRRKLIQLSFLVGSDYTQGMEWTNMSVLIEFVRKRNYHF